MNINVPAMPLRNLFVLVVCFCAGLAGGQSVSPPVIDRIERAANSIRFHLSGPPLFDYTLEGTDSLSPPNWLPLSSYRAKIEAIDVLVTHSLTNAQVRFFRVRQQPCNCR